MSEDSLGPYDGQATAESIHRFQQKIGSVNYAAVITRADIARTAARLSEFMRNPGPDHHAAADRAIQYLHSTKGLAIQYTGPPDDDPGTPYLLCSSDAAFADDPETRYSSQGYLTMLFGGPVAWRASKQRSVVTSSTEAELVALTAATREHLSMIRLIEQLGVDLEQPYTIRCDNQQTLRLLTSEKPQLTSRLKHICIQELWIRQTARNGHVQFEWIPTAQMVADGLTKALPPQKHTNFLTLLGLVDISDRIAVEGENRREE